VQVGQEVSARPDVQRGAGDAPGEFGFPADLDQLVVLPGPHIGGDGDLLRTEPPRPGPGPVILDHAFGLAEGLGRHGGEHGVALVAQHLPIDRPQTCGGQSAVEVRGPARREMHCPKAHPVEPGRRLGEPGVHPVERRQLCEHAGFGQRQGPGDDRETPDAGRHRGGRRGGVLAAHRPAHDGKGFYLKVIHQLADVGGPVQDRASGTGVRSSDARAVGGDHPDTRRAGRPVGRSDVESAGQTTVGVDDDGTIGCAVVGVGHHAPVAQPHRAVFAITGHGVRLP